MGKPFKQEIQNITRTIQWADDQDVAPLCADLLRHRDAPVFIVGSGGSLSACYLAAYLFQQMGVIAKAITPFDLFYALPAIRNAKVLFISASGKNSDIIFAFQTVIKSEPVHLISICMKKGTKLKQLASNYTSIAKVYELPLPSGKDGFLATNSLIAYFSILLKSFGYNLSDVNNYAIPEKFHAELKAFIKKIEKSFSFMVIYGGSAQPVAMDIESKFVEAALGDVLICDYRNFAHGRHHWFAKRGTNSCIVALITPSEEKLAEKTLSLLPIDIPILKIQTYLSDPTGSLELLSKSFHLASCVGEMQKIDPGRPGVPDYGSKLYNLKYSTKLQSRINPLHSIICRKAGCKSIEDLDDTEYSYWIDAYKIELKKIKSTIFGGIVFDYDGTLCNVENRFDPLSDTIVTNLIKILKGGLLVGIATGRGQSVRKELQNCIPKRYWSSVFVGYYNGSDISLLDDNSKPFTKPCEDPVLLQLYQIFQSKKYALEFKTELRPNQLTIEVNDSKNWSRIKPLVIQVVKTIDSNEIEFLESTHSIDIVKKKACSKLNLLPILQTLLDQRKLSRQILCIGDKGQWPGNDYELLTHEFSLSVNEVSNSPDSGWNFASPGLKNADALIEYFSFISIKKNGLTIKFDEKSVS